MLSDIKMARSRRSRRNRRRICKQQKQNAETNRNIIPKESVQETPTKDKDETFITLPNTITPPTRTPNISTHQKFNVSRRNSIITRSSNANSYKLLDKSPENRSINCMNNITPNTSMYRNLHIVKRQHNLIMKTTPIRKGSKLFEEFEENQLTECLNNVTPKCSRSLFNEVYINNLNRLASSTIKTSAKIKSRISKSRWPPSDKIPIMIDVATQTIYFDNSVEKENSIMEGSDIYLQSCINIFETPKISKSERFDSNSPLSYVLRSDSNINEDANVINKTNLDNLKYLQNFNEITLHPNGYISPKILLKDNRNNDSDSDASLFSPQRRTMSTPIDKLQKRDRILENMAKNIFAARLDRKFQSNFSPKNLNSNNKYDNKVYKEKIDQLDSCVNKFRMCTDIGGECNKSKNNSMIRIETLKNESNSIPVKTSFNGSGDVFNVPNSNIYGRFKTNIKKLQDRYSTKSLDVIKDICCRVGTRIKQKLSSLCFLAEDTEEIVHEQYEVIIPAERVCCNCGTYMEQITSLSTKVDNVNGEIDKIKEGLYELDVIKKKIKDMEEKFDNGLLIPVTPLPMPIPPPPPPPLPTFTSSPSATRYAKTTNSKKIHKKILETSRPVISLNDILNVKLKRTADRPVINRKFTQPFISVEMLNQTKLRPASRTETLCTSSEVSTPISLSSSPSNSLTKLLTNVDPTVRRLKRLRRVGGFSLDDSRKHILRRERWGGEDS